jgi:hypothetical protein
MVAPVKQHLPSKYWSSNSTTAKKNGRKEGKMGGREEGKERGRKVGKIEKKIRSLEYCCGSWCPDPATPEARQNRPWRGNPKTPFFWFKSVRVGFLLLETK